MRRHWFILLLLLGWLLPACEFRQTNEGTGTPIPLTNAPHPASTTPPINTPLPPLPTAPATAVPQPIPTYNPALADWTLLIYIAADNNMAAQSLRDLKEMTLAQSSTAVNILVQLDQPDSGATRYAIANEAAPGEAAPLSELGAVNMGDPQTLADFITWGVQTYPANHTALILWDHGAGWQGFAFDNGDTPDSLTLPELETAVAQATAQTNLPALDLIAFDACLMGQLDVLQAIQPFARYAVASAELTPGQGWDYQTTLSNLATNPGMDGAALAEALVQDFHTAYLDNDFVTMTAVDLSRLPDLTFAVETMAAALLNDPTFAASAVAEGRSGATNYARAYAADAEQYAAIDLGQFAAILAQRSPDELVRQSAAQVQQALANATLANISGAGLRGSGGVAVYFPRNRETYRPEYGRATHLTLWNRFLNSYYDVGLAAALPPAINLVSVLRDTVNVQQPAYLDFEVAGRDIGDVMLVGGLYEGDGRRRLLEYDRLIPEPTYLPDGSQLGQWRDGLHEDFFVWDTQVTYLYDAFEHGGFVVMWPTESGSALFTVQGQYRPAAAAEFTPASLEFDQRTGQMARLWVMQDGGAAEIAPAPGDEFQVYDYYLGDNDAITRTSGGSLFFDQAAQLYFDWRPLPDGGYFLGFAAQNAAGQQASAFTDLTINNSAAQPGLRAYLDPYLGFQFLYPETWYTPVYTQSILYSSDAEAQTFLQLTVYPDLSRAATANTLQAEALRDFGAVDVLFTDDVNVAGVRGLRTAYGYERADGAPRTGLLVTFVQNGAGYVLDVDGPLAGEEGTITAVTTLITSWQFTGAGFGVQPGQWAQRDLAHFSVAQPADFTYQPTNDWQRFSADRDTFVALRVRPASADVDTALANLVRDAGNGVSDFAAQEPRRFALGAVPWQRVDFAYTNGDGKEIWGFVMVKMEGGQEVVAWAEAPRSTYNDLETRVFLVMIAGMGE
ncbi:MAG: hypothetical protein H6662_14435 [Ardenticatenaceae bacterium]|nr:hypothetical protein [Ardenticatenaceae bacterium]